MNKSQAENFLKKELKDLATQRGATPVPEQATFNMAEAAKIRLKQR